MNITSPRALRGSIVVSIPACHAGDPGSIPGHGAFYFYLYNPRLFHFATRSFQNLEVEGFLSVGPALSPR